MSRPVVFRISLAAALATATVASGIGTAVGQDGFLSPSIRAVEEAPLQPVSENAIVLPFGEPASEFIGRPVRGRWNAPVGEVMGVLGPEKDNPTALAVDVGGYAGAQRPVILPLDQFVGSDVLMVTLSANQLARFPRYEF